MAEVEREVGAVMVEVVRNAEGMWVVMKREVEVRMEEVAREEEAMLAVVD